MSGEIERELEGIVELREWELERGESRRERLGREVEPGE